MPTLSGFRSNVYSQNGEDGVIAEVCRRLSITSGFFVEFGAWDGKHLSNTFKLLEAGWGGLYIESDPARYGDLISNMAVFGEHITLVNALVEPAGDDALDNILTRAHVAQSFDLLSVDIDSFDWQIWESLNRFKPKIVVIEINSSIPVGIYQTYRSSSAEPGASFTSMVELGRAKGYVPVCHTGNLIFVSADLVSQLNLSRQELLYPEVLFDQSWCRLRYVSPIPAPFAGLARLYARLNDSVGRKTV
jgi:hypothetical protein